MEEELLIQLLQEDTAFQVEDLVLVPVLALEEEELDVLEKTSTVELLIIKKY